MLPIVFLMVTLLRLERVPLANLGIELTIGYFVYLSLLMLKVLCSFRAMFLLACLCRSLLKAMPL